MGYPLDMPQVFPIQTLAPTLLSFLPTPSRLSTSATSTGMLLKVLLPQQATVHFLLSHGCLCKLWPYVSMLPASSRSNVASALQPC